MYCGHSFITHYIGDANVKDGFISHLLALSRPFSLLHIRSFGAGFIFRYCKIIRTHCLAIRGGNMQQLSHTRNRPRVFFRRRMFGYKIEWFWMSNSNSQGPMIRCDQPLNRIKRTMIRKIDFIRSCYYFTSFPFLWLRCCVQRTELNTKKAKKTD